MEKEMKKASKYEIVMMPIVDVIPYDNNPRKNNDAVKPVSESIKQFGFRSPITVDKNNVIITGHTRLLAAKRLKLKEVPCMVASDLTEEQVKAYRLADNKVGEIATWDMDKLEAEIKGIENIDLSLLGFEEFSDIFPKDYFSTDSEDLEEIMTSEECFVNRGDIWQLGRHRVMCGDSTSFSDMEKLMDGELADLVETDPPYNMDLQDEVEGTTETLQNDNLTEDGFRQFLSKAYENIRRLTKTGKSIYVFHSYHAAEEFLSEFKKSGLVYEQGLIWKKNAFSLSGSLYQHQHEQIIFGRNGGMAGDRTWNSGRSDSDTIENPKIEDMTKEELEQAYKELMDVVKGTVLEFDRNTDEKIHTTMKPTPLIVELMRNSSNIGELVLDPFLGSGTTIIAAEQCDRICYGMEMSELFCTRLIKRWQNMTGKRAVKCI